MSHVKNLRSIKQIYLFLQIPSFSHQWNIFIHLADYIFGLIFVEKNYLLENKKSPTSKWATWWLNVKFVVRLCSLCVLIPISCPNGAQTCPNTDFPKTPWCGMGRKTIAISGARRMRPPAPRSKFSPKTKQPECQPSLSPLHARSLFRARRNWPQLRKFGRRRACKSAEDNLQRCSLCKKLVRAV